MYRILLKNTESEVNLQYYLENGEVYETSSVEELKQKYLEVIQTVPSAKVTVVDVLQINLEASIQEENN